MKVVHIYAESGTGTFQRTNRGVGYVLELVSDGRTYTKEHFTWMTGTYNEVILAAFVDALTRMKEKCEIHLHTQNRPLLRMIGNKSHLTWRKNGFRTSRGGELANAELWKRFAELAEGHLIVPEEGSHSYEKWMMQEMKHNCIA